LSLLLLKPRIMMG